MRIRPAFQHGRFAGEDGCYARPVPHLDAIAVDHYANSARAAQVAAPKRSIAILQQNEIAIAQLVKPKAGNLSMICGHDVIIAVCRRACANAAAHKVSRHPGCDWDDQLAILYGNVHLFKQIGVKVHAKNGVFKTFDFHALPLRAHLDAVANGELVERIFREIAENMLYAAVRARDKAARALCIAGYYDCRIANAGKRVESGFSCASGLRTVTPGSTWSHSMA